MVALPLLNFGIMILGAMTFISYTSSSSTARDSRTVIQKTTSILKTAHESLTVMKHTANDKMSEMDFFKSDCSFLIWFFYIIWIKRLIFVFSSYLFFKNNSKFILNLMSFCKSTNLTMRATSATSSDPKCLTAVFIKIYRFFHKLKISLEFSQTFSTTSGWFLFNLPCGAAELN